MKLIGHIYSFCIQCVQSCFTILKVCILSKWFVRFPQPAKQKECIILGNGPSLQSSIAAVKNISVYDLFAVNYFANSDLFHQIKPQFYVILAPEIWEENPIDSVKHDRDILFAALQKVNWNMHFFIPFFAKKSAFWKPLFCNHKHISIVYFNATPVEGLRCVNHFFYKKNLGMPRPHNVLTPCLMFAIALKYKKIHVFGADHSWLQHLWVTPQNEVLLTQKHFYDNDTAKPLPMNNYKERKTRALHEILHKFMLAFASYFDINAYAKSQDCTILNATPESYIDAFERESLT
jgi:hypothetical protein